MATPLQAVHGISEDRMLNSQARRIAMRCAIACVVICLSSAAWVLASPAPANSDASLLDGFRHVEVASVSDAIEQLIGKRMYMSHRMQPIFTTKFAGYAVTVRLKKDEGTKDPAALNG